MQCSNMRTKNLSPSALENFEQQGGQCTVCKKKFIVNYIQDSSLKIAFCWRVLLFYFYRNTLFWENKCLFRYSEIFWNTLTGLLGKMPCLVSRYHFWGLRVPLGMILTRILVEKTNRFFGSMKYLKKLHGTVHRS